MKIIIAISASIIISASSVSCQGFTVNSPTMNPSPCPAPTTPDTITKPKPKQ